MTSSRFEEPHNKRVASGIRRSRSGWAFDFAADRWVIHEHVNEYTFDFRNLAVEPPILETLKYVMVWFVENLSCAASVNYLNGFRRFVRRSARSRGKSLSRIDSADLLSYRAKLGRNNMCQLGAVSRVVRKWHALGLPGVTDAAAELLDELTIPGNRRGEAVRTMDTVKGPLIDIEYDSVVGELRDRYQCGQLSSRDYALSLLVISLGPRPLQLAGLKLKDLCIGRDANGSAEYLLRVPRSKQPGRPLRSLFTDRLLHSELGALVEAHVNSIRSQLRDLLPDIEEAPLFPSRRGVIRPPGFELHSSSKEISKEFSRIVQGLKLTSVRTGRAMRLSPYRFRRTVGTRAAAEGAGELVIAELLDHTDTQNVGVYVESVPAFAQRIDRAAALHFAALSNAFTGEPVPRRDIDQRSATLHEIWSPQFSEPGHTNGGCIESGPCSALAPIACYTCRRFRPFMDGPHQAVLDHLLEQREALRLKDERVAKVLDRTILAVAQVIRKCEPQRKVDR